MDLGILLLILLVLLVVLAIPAWPYSRGWGYVPSGVVGILLLILILALFLGWL